MLAIPVLSPADSAAWDHDANQAGILPATLMECAGRAAAAVIAARFRTNLSGGVIVACGTGNNGGDGWVLARVLHRAGVSVWVAPLAGSGSELQVRMAGLARAEGIRVVDADGPWPGVGLAVDAILGTGAKGIPRQPAADLVTRLHDLRVPVVALDGPTGVDLAHGTTHGTARADLSITFGGLRRGHVLARDQVGAVVVVDIGLPAPRPEWPVVVTDRIAATLLPAIKANAHKGDRGRIVAVGGARGMTGALRMAGRAAFAGGAGLVHVVGPEATIQTVRSADPDLQTLVQDLDAAPTEDLLALIRSADAIVVGPGLGRAPNRNAFLVPVLEAARRAVIDADALIAFSSESSKLRDLCLGKPFVLTPHPGEFRALFPELASRMELDPWDAGAQAAPKVGATVLLKGVPTVVAREGAPVLTVVAGNPGLATGGSGDVLAGLVATFLAQGLEPEQAAALGAQVLGRSADLAARRLAARSLRPHDVVAAVPDVWRAWRVVGESSPVPPVLFELEQPERT
jgi:NAD(P)H-hydrate epimerase